MSLNRFDQQLKHIFFAFFKINYKPIEKIEKNERKIIHLTTLAIKRLLNDGYSFDTILKVIESEMLKRENIDKEFDKEISRFLESDIGKKK